MSITSGKRAVRLGSLKGLYERFLIRNLIRYSPPTQAKLYWDGPLQYYFLHGWNNLVSVGQKSIKGTVLQD